MTDRSQDWYAQAERDLELAVTAQSAGRHEWSCFAAQQSAEKAVKALHLKLGQEAWGHVVGQLLSQLPIAAPADLLEKGKVLDNFYVPTRCPNGHPDGPPYVHYGPLQSNLALDYAGQILAFVRIQMAGA